MVKSGITPEAVKLTALPAVPCGLSFHAWHRHHLWMKLPGLSDEMSSSGSNCQDLSKSDFLTLTSVLFQLEIP